MEHPKPIRVAQQLNDLRLLCVCALLAFAASSVSAAVVHADRGEFCPVFTGGTPCLVVFGSGSGKNKKSSSKKDGGGSKGLLVAGAVVVGLGALALLTKSSGSSELASHLRFEPYRTLTDNSAGDRGVQLSFTPNHSTTTRAFLAVGARLNQLGDRLDKPEVSESASGVLTFISAGLEYRPSATLSWRLHWAERQKLRRHSRAFDRAWLTSIEMRF